MRQFNDNIVFSKRKCPVCEGKLVVNSIETEDKKFKDTLETCYNSSCGYRCWAEDIGENTNA